VDPQTDQFPELVANMENALQCGAAKISIPIRPIEVPFEGIGLPGHFLDANSPLGPTLLIVGGGDTFREDLVYFGGLAGWRRGYNVVMVDLPGQGKVPGLGLHFRQNMAAPIAAALDWIEQALPSSSQIAIYGLSGGGLFTAQAAAADRRIRAWIASTPIIDVGRLFAVEFGAAARVPGWIASSFLRVAGALNHSTDLSLKKYAWQFGGSDFAEVVGRIVNEAAPVAHEQISCPALFLMGSSEAEELRRQTRVLFDLLRSRGVDVALKEFSAADGADAHCQINNLPLAHRVIFDWLDSKLDRGSQANQQSPACRF
jgi:pimeloyl-ACP methyl ester carboxylesterase